MKPTIFGVTERNVLNPEVTYRIINELLTDNAWVNSWLSSTFRTFLIHNLPVIEIVPVWVYRSWVLNNPHARQTSHPPVAPLLKEHPEWVHTALAEDRTVQLLHIVDVFHPQHPVFPFHSDAASSYVLDSYLNLPTFRHWIDYLVSTNPDRQIRDTIEVVHDKTIKWTAKLALQKLLKEQVEDVLLLPLDVLKDTPYYLVCLLTENAYTREGKLMRNCVASYWTRPTSLILSLRSVDSVKPLATVEVGKPRPTFIETTTSNEVQSSLAGYTQGKLDLNGARIIQAESFAKNPFTEETLTLLQLVYDELGLKRGLTLGVGDIRGLVANAGGAGGGGGVGYVTGSTAINTGDFFVNSMIHNRGSNNVFTVENIQDIMAEYLRNVPNNGAT